MKTYEIDLEMRDGVTLKLEIEAEVKYPTPFSSSVAIKSIKDNSCYFGTGKVFIGVKEHFTRESREEICDLIRDLDKRPGRATLQAELVRIGLLNKDRLRTKQADKKARIASSDAVKVSHKGVHGT